MALPRASGRTRTVHCTANYESLIRNGRVTNPGTGATASDVASASVTWFPMGSMGAAPTITSLRVNVTHPVSGVVYIGGANGFASGPQVAWPVGVPIPVWIEYRFTGGASLTTNTTISLPTGAFPSVFVGAIQFLTASADATTVVEAAATLAEWINADFTRSERRTACSHARTVTWSDLSVFISFSGDIWATFTVPVPGTATAFDTGSNSTLVTSLNYEWTHTLGAATGLSVTSALSIGGPGMEGYGVPLPPASGLTGTSLVATWSGAGGGTVKGEPGWALDLGIDFRNYDGDPLPVDTIHYCGNGLTVYDEVSRGNGAHRYPPTGLTAWAQYTIGSSTWENYRRLGRCGNVPTNLNSSNYIKINPQAADQNGILFNAAGNGIWCPFAWTPAFDAATLQIASSHTFALFNTLANWAANPNLTFGTALTYTNPDATARSVNATYTLRPYGYRYYRFACRAATPGARLALILKRDTARPSTPQEILDGYGLVRTFTAEYRWEFTVAEANTWETLEFDLCFPDSLTDGASFDVRYVLHPELFLAGDGTDGLTLQFLSAGAYELRDFQGYHRADDGRKPVRLTSYLSLNGALPQDEDLEEYEEPSLHPNLNYADANYAWGRCIVNGARGFWFGRTVGLTSQTVKSVWTTNIRGVLDTGTKDTGITINVDPSTTYPEEVEYRVSARPLTTGLVEQIDSTTFTARHQYRAMSTFGYYGMGDVSTGGYSATLVHRGAKWLQTVVQGLTRLETAPTPRVKVDLRDQPGGNHLDTTRADADGYFQLRAPYGVVRTYSNLPITADWADRKQFTESGGAVTGYTGLGTRFRAHALRSRSFVHRDAQNYLTRDGVRRPIVAIERYPTWVDVEAYPVVSRPVDLAETPNGWLWRAVRIDAEIRVEYSRDAAVTWEGVTVASDAADDDAYRAAAPTLAVDPWGGVIVWYHDGAENAQAYRTEDGQTWTPLATQTGLLYPRMALPLGLPVLAGFVGGRLGVWETADYGATLGNAVGAEISEADIGRVELRVDRREQLHLVYSQAPAVLHRHYRVAQQAWSEPETLLTAERAGYAGGLERAAAVAFEPAEETLLAVTTEETWGGTPTPIESPTTLLQLDYPGLLWDRRGTLWLCAANLPGELTMLYWRPDGQGWRSPE